MNDVRFEGPRAHAEHAPLELRLSPAVSIRRLDPLEPHDLERVTCQALGIKALPDRLPARDAFRAAHPCAILQIDMPPVESLRDVAVLMRHAGPVWLLALSLRVGAECEPIAQVLLDRRDRNAEIDFYSGFPHAYVAHMNSAWDHCRRAVPGLARDPRLRLYAVLFRDFLREPEDSPAILKGWSLLEVMAADETGGKKDMVRALCKRLGTNPNGKMRISSTSPTATATASLTTGGATRRTADALVSAGKARAAKPG